MAQITYADKVALNENSAIADINKVNATDMNEIKSVVNGLLSDTQTNDNTLGYNAPYINNRFKLLWSNPDVSAGMSAGTTINLSSSDYDLLVWVFCYNISNTNMQNSVTVKKGSNAMSGMIGYSNGALQRRTITYVSDTQYSATVGVSSQTTVNGNNINIPVCVYGIKGN